jgi:hypothetical protein
MNRLVLHIAEVAFSAAVAVYCRRLVPEENVRHLGKVFSALLYRGDP